MRPNLPLTSLSLSEVSLPWCFSNNDIRKRNNASHYLNVFHSILDSIVYPYFVVAADCEASAVNQLDTKILPICKLIINTENVKFIVFFIVPNIKFQKRFLLNMNQKS